MDAPNDVNPELESFREQWRAEVRARKPAASGSHQQSSTSSTSHAEPSRRIATSGPPPRPTTQLSSGRPKVLDTGADEDYVEPLAFDDSAPAQSAQPARHNDWEDEEPVTALDHYERAVEKESQGSLGDSLMLYRKAFRVRTVPC